MYNHHNSFPNTHYQKLWMRTLDPFVYNLDHIHVSPKLITIRYILPTIVAIKILLGIVIDHHIYNSTDANVRVIETNLKSYNPPFIMN